MRVRGRADRPCDDGRIRLQMLSLGGVDHLTGGSKTEGRVTCDALLQPVQSRAGGGARSTMARPWSSRRARPPVINGVREKLMRVGCGSATIGMFAQQWLGHVDEVVVVDDHITGVLSEHQAGKLLDMPPTGIRMKGRRSTPGRYFQVAEPGTGWGGTDIEDPADHPWPVRSEGRLARPAHADGLHHRRAMGLLRARRRSGTHARRALARRCAPRPN